MFWGVRRGLQEGRGFGLVYLFGRVVVTSNAHTVPELVHVIIIRLSRGLRGWAGLGKAVLVLLRYPWRRYK